MRGRPETPLKDNAGSLSDQIRVLSQIASPIGPAENRNNLGSLLE